MVLVLERSVTLNLGRAESQGAHWVFTVSTLTILINIPLCATTGLTLSRSSAPQANRKWSCVNVWKSVNMNQHTTDRVWCLNKILLRTELDKRSEVHPIKTGVSLWKNTVSVYSFNNALHTWWVKSLILWRHVMCNIHAQVVWMLQSICKLFNSSSALLFNVRKATLFIYLCILPCSALWLSIFPPGVWGDDILDQAR